MTAPCPIMTPSAVPLYAVHVSPNPHVLTLVLRFSSSEFPAAPMQCHLPPSPPLPYSISLHIALPFRSLLHIVPFLPFDTPFHRLIPPQASHLSSFLLPSSRPHPRSTRIAHYRYPPSCPLGHRSRVAACSIYNTASRPSLSLSPPELLPLVYLTHPYPLPQCLRSHFDT